ncbi:hypothetical protein VB716_08530 [Synechococcus sp. CCY9201]|uniref:hypothetical protein n=1 Tax=unclassified Synechococcus TaxID=2626047 RepID=UPI0018CE8F03|nr:MULTISPECIES: hypothetical protein [unclassified Synechococcus]MEA5474265.1 hypothetical protein [Synechococcus sp. CCY9201]QPN59702.1 hypothetical protein H8F24_17385 [Synechococcus sp. CBW1002]QPN66523.1 hypothetical protein H8F26_17640 [Synechococcus sp. CBW1006]
MTRITIQWQNQFGRWQHYTSSHHEPSAFRSAQQRARSTGKRHRLIDDEGRVLDIIEP